MTLRGCINNVREFETNNEMQEDLDLLSFSSIPQSQAHPQGLPLKAVFRDSVVGVRYLHPRVVATGATPVRSLSTFRSSLLKWRYCEVVSALSDYVPVHVFGLGIHRLNPLRLSLQGEFWTTSW